MAFFEKTLETDVKYKGRILTVRQDTVLLQNGERAFREVVEHSGGVGVVAIREDGRIPMVRQFRYPFGKEVLEIPAGKLEPGEDPVVCARRELSEETGYEAKSLVSLGELLPSPGYCYETLYVYLTLDAVPGISHPDRDEFLSVEYYTLDELLDMVASGELNDAKTVIGILKTAMYLDRYKAE